MNVLKERTAAIYAAIRPDFGELNNTDELLLTAACRLLARAQAVQNTDAQVRLTSEGRRGIDALRRRAPKREEKGDRLASYLANKYGDRGAEPVGDAGRVDGDAGPPGQPQDRNAHHGARPAASGT